MSAFDTIIKFAASGHIEGQAWGELVKLVHSTSLDDARTLLNEGEKEYKERTSEKKMPSTYRSAKSVVLRALGVGVPLLSDNNEPLGKSAIEKAVRDECHIPLGCDETIKKHVRTIYHIYLNCDDLARIEAINALKNSLSECFPTHF